MKQNTTTAGKTAAYPKQMVIIRDCHWSHNTELQISIMDGAVIDKLQSVNMSVVWVLRDLQKIKAEFEDMTAA